MDQTPQTNPDLNWLLDYAIQQKASDLHILAEVAPTIRLDGSLVPIPDLPPYTAEQATEIVLALIGHSLFNKINESRKELDFSFSYRSLRFRCNVFFSKGVLSASLRVLPNRIPELSLLGVPPMVSKMIEHRQGLIIVTGPTGSGKSTTLAAMLNQIVGGLKGHVITIEDPIEYVFSQGKSIISQREVGNDTVSFASALRSALREDPDVVLVGEMRDLETVEAALQMAETGHLVLTSLHTNSAAQTADRIVDIFPASQQRQVRQQLADSLIGILSQRLLPKVHGGRVLACELMMANSAVRSIIREGKTHQIPNLIQTSAGEGMIALEKSLAELVSRGEIAVEEAMNWAIDQKSLRMQIY